MANKLTADRQADALATYDAVVAVMSECPTLEEGLAQLDAAHVPYRELPGLKFIFEEPEIWQLSAKIFDYDPGPALSHIRAPVLAVFGAADEVTPPEESIEALRHAVQPQLLHVEAFPEGDHRLMCGEPPRFVDGYLDGIASFVRAASSGTLE